jgi:hypothetical protein
MLRLRGRVKPGHFRGLTFSDFDPEGRPGMFAVEIYAAVRRFVFVTRVS